MNKNECIKSFDFKLFVQEKHAPFYEKTCLLNELYEKLNHTKISKF